MHYSTAAHGVQVRLRAAWMWVAVAGITVLYVCSTLPTPLHPLYRQSFGFSELTVTTIYASYIIGNLVVLFTLGRLSDQLGRRPTSLVAFGILFLSTACFLSATSTAWLFAARILNGVAAGANSLPVIGVGLLARTSGAATAHLVLALLLAIIAGTTGWKYAPTS
ncbi:MAG: MFS transporter [Steroidobacteraceae bacterium]